MAPAAASAKRQAQQHQHHHPQVELELLSDGAEEAAWATLKEALPEQAARLQRIESLERGVQQRLVRKRRLSTLHMLGPSLSTHPLRLWVTHAVQHPPPGGWPKHRAPRSAAKLPMWTLRVEGGLLAEEDGTGSASQRLSTLGRLSEFFERMTVTLDRVREDEEKERLERLEKEKGKAGGDGAAAGAAGAPEEAGGGERREAEKVEWVRPKETYGIEVDGFQLALHFPGPDVTELPLRIALHRRQLNPLLTPKKLSPELSKLLRLRREERREAVEAALFEAVRHRSWFLPHRPGWVTLDPEAAKLLGLPHGEKEEDREKRTMRLVELNAKVEEHLSEADPWTIDYDVTLAEEEEEAAAAADAQGQQGQEQQPPSGASKKEGDGGEGEGEEDEEEQLKWKGRKVFDVRVDAPAGGGLLPRFNLACQETTVAAQQAQKRARARRRALEQEGEEAGGLLARVAAAEEEEAAALAGGWEDGGALTRGVDGRIAFVGGLLTEKAQKIARLQAVAADPGGALARLAAEEAGAAQALSEAQGSLPTMAALLRRLDQPSQQSQSAPSSSVRWVAEALQEYLAHPHGFK